MQQLQLLGKGLLCKTGLSLVSGQPAQSGGRSTLAGHPAVCLEGLGHVKGTWQSRSACPPRGAAPGDASGPNCPLVPMLTL